MDKKLLPIKAAAMALGVKAENLRQEIEQEALPSIRVGDERLVVLADVERALLRRTRTHQKGKRHAP